MPTNILTATKNKGNLSCLLLFYFIMNFYSTKESVIGTYTKQRQGSYAIKPRPHFCWTLPQDIRKIIFYLMNSQPLARRSFYAISDGRVLQKMRACLKSVRTLRERVNLYSYDI